MRVAFTLRVPLEAMTGLQRHTMMPQAVHCDTERYAIYHQVGLLDSQALAGGLASRELFPVFLPPDPRP
jgi:hypothetical protein